jgi:hypothetical protein
MMRLRRASAIVALSLVASAATAYADCAWVLWATLARSVNGGAYQPEAPTLLTAYTKATDCTAWLDRTQLQGDQRFVPATMDRYITEKGTDTLITHVKWQCLPDTIDPRGPKGK